MSAFSSDSQQQPEMAQLVENNNEDTLVEVFRLQDIWQQVAEIVENNKTERFSEANLIQMLNAYLDGLPRHAGVENERGESPSCSRKSNMLPEIRLLPRLPHEQISWPVELGNERHHATYPSRMQPPASWRLPPELFDNIIFHAGHTRQSRHDKYTGIGAVTKVCSLVCRHWANGSRWYLFFERTLMIDSFEKATDFVQYTLRGSPALVPLYKLIRGIKVCQEYSTPRSFCHLFHLYKSLIGLQLSELTITGPIPPSFPSRLLGTPHWSLPPSAVTPPSLLPYHTIHLYHIHLPSFAHVAKYIGHFANASVHTLFFRQLTWDTSGRELPSIPSRHREFTKLGRGCLEVVTDDCTDNLLPCYQIAATHPLSLMCTLSDERQWIFVIWQKLQDSFYRSPNISEVNCGYNSSAYTYNTLSSSCNASYAQQSCHSARTAPTEIFGLMPCNSMSPDSVTSTSLCVVGCMLYIDEKLWKTRNGDYNDVRVKDLMTYFSRFAKLRIVVMAFNYSFEGNQLWHQRDAMGRFYLHAPFDADHTYTCIWVRRQDGYTDSSTPGNICSQQLVGIDPVTLDFTGEVWKNEEDILLSFTSSLAGGYNSSLDS